MSHDASVDVHVAPGYSVRHALNGLLSCGWSYDDHGSIRFLPLNAGDEYDWQSRSVAEWNVVERELIQKEHAGELIGVALVWKDTMRGGEMLFFNSKVTLSASSERLRLANSEFTDFSWYLDKLVPPLINAGLDVFRVACSDCR